ncbi:MAG: inorganic diphosphatase [Janthinobacterium lividum]
MNSLLKARIVHFFEHYKDLEKGKWVSIKGWEKTDESIRLINEGIKRFDSISTELIKD